MKKYGDALIIIDVQNDYCEGGALPVPGGDEVVPVINSMMKNFPNLIFVKSSHNEDHISFACNHPGQKPFTVVQTVHGEMRLWPKHCIQDTYGEQLHSKLNTERNHKLFKKRDSYSAFIEEQEILEDEVPKKYTLGDYLKKLQVKTVMCVGLATDYCVKESAIDSVKLGFKTAIYFPACRGIEKETTHKALVEMVSGGVSIII